MFLTIIFVGITVSKNSNLIISIKFFQLYIYLSKAMKGRVCIKILRCECVQSANTEKDISRSFSTSMWSQQVEINMTMMMIITSYMLWRSFGASSTSLHFFPIKKSKLNLSQMLDQTHVYLKRLADAKMSRLKSIFLTFDEMFGQMFVFRCLFGCLFKDL